MGVRSSRGGQRLAHAARSAHADDHVAAPRGAAPVRAPRARGPAETTVTVTVGAAPTSTTRVERATAPAPSPAAAVAGEVHASPSGPPSGSV